MALYAFDGTWNTVKDNEDPKYQNTNVVRFFNAYDKHAGTKNLYRAGGHAPSTRSAVCSGRVRARRAAPVERGL
jgi:hypothetical protein